MFERIEVPGVFNNVASRYTYSLSEIKYNGDIAIISEVSEKFKNLKGVGKITLEKINSIVKQNKILLSFPKNLHKEYLEIRDSIDTHMRA